MSRHDDYIAKLRYLYEFVLSYQGDDCLPWPFTRNAAGYGRTRINGRMTIISREVCRLVHGEPPAPNLDAAHNCGNGRGGCVNPRHLQWKTRAENVADKVIHGTSNRGERCGSAKLTESQVREIIALKGHQPQTEVAARFGVHQVTIGKIQNRLLWRHLHDAALLSAEQMSEAS